MVVVKECNLRCAAHYKVRGPPCNQSLIGAVMHRIDVMLHSEMNPLPAT